MPPPQPLKSKPLCDFHRYNRRQSCACLPLPCQALRVILPLVFVAACLTITHPVELRAHQGNGQQPIPRQVEPEEVKTGPAEQPQLEEPKGAEPTEKHEGWFPTIARLINASILFGTLLYFLRRPISDHLTGRQDQVRQDLVTATEMRKTAAEQLEELDRKMRSLPGEIEALKTQGAREIAQEHMRIKEAADAERQRLLDLTRRDINLQLRIAQRELVEHAANVAIGMATDRIKDRITDQDEMRLLDRYVEQLKK